jgi:hypothetical protein
VIGPVAAALSGDHVAKPFQKAADLGVGFGHGGVIQGLRQLSTI